MATGPLSACPTNSRYFADKSGKAVYLTESHTWCNFATDQGDNDPPSEFDFNGYLDFLTNHNHSFFRGWVWELAYSEQGPMVVPSAGTLFHGCGLDPATQLTASPSST